MPCMSQSTESAVRSDAGNGGVGNVFTVDVEDWCHGLEVIPITEWHRYESRLVGPCERILELLDLYGSRATFFVLGYVAEKFPQLVRRIAENHEVGTHGYDHQLIYRQPPNLYREMLSRSIQAVQDAAGKPVLGHRAPFFSVTSHSLWALDIMAELRLLYDSSIFPVFNYRYGIPGEQRHASILKLSKGKRLLEIPMATVRRSGLNIPMAGGAYLRIYPGWMIPWGIRQMNSEGLPAVIYIHPWELDPGHPRPTLPWRIRVTHYHNLHKTEERLVRLLREFRFGPICEVFNREVEQVQKQQP